MKITILYDNTTINPQLEADWGFSCLVEAHGRNILFDTGADGEILLRNMEVLSIDPLEVSDVFISHCHFDHTGGLSHFLNINSRVCVHAPVTFKGIKKSRETVYYDAPQMIYDGIGTTGQLSDIEQSMLVKSEKGILVITGCSHPPMESILKTASTFGTVNAIIGGLHDFSKLNLLNNMDRICPTHCTRYKEEINDRFAEKVISGGVGTILEF